MIKASEISGVLQQRVRDEHEHAMAKYVPQIMRRLENNFNSIAKLHIIESGREGNLTFKAEWDGERTVTLTPSDVDLFKSLEMGEFDDKGQMVKGPHSIIAEWRVQVKLPKRG